MLTICWSVKGGVGTSVVAAGLAVRTAAAGVDCLLVDLGGDQSAVLGSPPPTGPGVAEWLSAGDDVPVDALARLESPVSDRLALLHRGEGVIADHDRLTVLAALLAGSSRACVVDAGPSAALGPWWVGLGRSVLVLRPCYLALRRVGGIDPETEVVVIEEPGRALDSRDVGSATGARLRCRLPWDPAVARAVDAGLLATRLPRSLRTLGTAA